MADHAEYCLAKELLRLSVACAQVYRGEKKMVVAHQRLTFVLVIFPISGLLTIFNVFLLRGEVLWCNYVLLFMDVLALFVDVHPNWLTFTTHALTIATFHQLFLISDISELVLLSLLRILNLIPTSSSIQHCWTFRFFQALLLPFAITGCWVWIACPFSALPSCRDDNNWINHDDVVDVNNMPDVFVRSMYFILQSFTTVGFGDVLPRNKNEISFCIVLTVISMLFWNGFNSLVVSCTKWFNYNSLAVTEEVATLRSWLAASSLPDVIGRVIVSHKLQLPGGLSAENLWHKLPLSVVDAILGNRLKEMLSIDRSLNAIQSKDILSYSCLSNYIKGAMLCHLDQNAPKRTFMMLDGRVQFQSPFSAKQEKSNVICVGSALVASVDKDDILRMQSIDMDKGTANEENNDEEDNHNSKLLLRQKALFMLSSIGNKLGKSSKHRLQQFEQPTDEQEQNREQLRVMALLLMLLTVFTWTIITPTTALISSKRSQHSNRTSWIFIFDLGLVGVYVVSRVAELIIEHKLSLRELLKVSVWWRMSLSSLCASIALVGEVLALVPFYLFTSDQFKVILAILCLNRCLLVSRIPGLLVKMASYFQSSIIMSSVQSSSILETAAWSCFLGSSLVCLWIYIWSTQKQQEQHFSSAAIDGTYWVFTVMSTTGYGDIVPENMKEMWHAIAALVFGPATFSLLIAYIVNFIFSKDVISKQLQESELHRMYCTKYLRTMQIEECESDQLGSAILKQEHQVPLSHFEVTMDVERVIRNSNLGIESLNHIRSLLCSELVRRSRLFRSQSESVVNAAVQNLRQLLYIKHSVIISTANNRRCKGIYFIRIGAVQIKFSSALVCSRFAGDYFGEESFYPQENVVENQDEARRHVESDAIDNTKAMSDSELWLLPEHALYSIIKSEKILLTSIIQPKIKRPSKPSRTISRTASILLRMRKKLSLSSKVTLYYQQMVFVSWVSLLRISILFYALIIPYQVGFGCGNLLPPSSELMMNYLFDGCWLLYLICLYSLSKAQNPKDCSWLLVVGAVAVLPLEAFTRLLDNQQSIYNHNLVMTQLFYALRLNKLLYCLMLPSIQHLSVISSHLFPRAFDKTKQSSDQHQNSFISKLIYCLCISTVLLLIVANASASLFFLVARFADSHHENNWLSEYLDDGDWSARYCSASLPARASEGSWQLYLISLYWAMTMLTTTGYGDIYPVTQVERLINVILYGCGAIFFAVAFSNLIVVFSEESNARENHKERVNLANRVLDFENASEDDKHKSNEALELQWKHFKGYDISSLQSAIGTQRYQSLMNDLLIPFFHENFLFTRLNIGFIEDLAAKMTLHVLPKGSVITSAGVLVDELLALVNGEIVFDNRNDTNHHHDAAHSHNNQNVTLRESTQRACNNYSNNIWRRGRANDRQEYKRQQNGIVNVSEFVQRNASACTVWTSKESCVARISYEDFYALAVQHQMIPLLLRCIRTVSKHELVKYSTEELVRHYKVNRMKMKIDKIIPLLLNQQSNTSASVVQVLLSVATALICIVGLVQIITAPALLLFADNHSTAFYCTNFFVDFSMQILLIIYFALSFYNNSVEAKKVQPFAEVRASPHSFIIQQKWMILCSLPYSLVAWLATAHRSYYVGTRLISIIPTAVLVLQSYTHLFTNNSMDKIKQRKWYLQLPFSQNIMFVMLMILYAGHLFACMLVGFSSSAAKYDYQLSLFWSLYTLSTIGYGSVSLQGSVQLLIAVSALLSASFLCSLLSAGINDSVDRIINANGEIRRVKAAIRQYLSTHPYNQVVGNAVRRQQRDSMQDVQEYFAFLETHLDGKSYSQAYSSILLFSKRHMFRDCYTLLRRSPCIQQMCHLSQVEGMIHSIYRAFQPYYAGRNEVLFRRQCRRSSLEELEQEHLFVLRRGTIICNETRVFKENSIMSSEVCVHTFTTSAVINDHDPTRGSLLQTAGNLVDSIASIEFSASELILNACDVATVTIVVWSSGNHCWFSSSPPVETVNEREEVVYLFKVFSTLQQDSLLCKQILLPQPKLGTSPTDFCVFISHNHNMFYECCSGKLHYHNTPQDHRQSSNTQVEYKDIENVTDQEGKKMLTTESFESGRFRLRKSNKPVAAPALDHQLLVRSKTKRVDVASIKKTLSSWFRNNNAPVTIKSSTRAFDYKESSDTSDDSSDDDEDLQVHPINNSRGVVVKSSTSSAADAVRLFSTGSIIASITSYNNIIDTNSSAAFHTLSSSDTTGDNEVATSKHAAGVGSIEEESNLVTIVLEESKMAKCTVKLKLQASFKSTSQYAADESTDVVRSWRYECSEPSHLLRLHVKDRANLVKSYRAMYANWRVKDRLLSK